MEPQNLVLDPNFLNTDNAIREQIICPYGHFYLASLFQDSFVLELDSSEIVKT